MKLFNILIVLPLLYSGCDNWPGETNTDSKSEVSANLDNGGSGSENNPYEIGSGIFTVIDDEDYYDFEVENSNNDCSLILYDVYLNNGSYTMATNNATYSSNLSAEIYSTYKYMTKGTFVITNSSDKNSKFGLYSTCVNSTYNYEIREFTSSSNSYEINSNYELFTFELTSDADISFTYSGTGSYSSYYKLLFNEDFDRVYSFDELEEGKYYILLQGSSIDTPKIEFSSK